MKTSVLNVAVAILAASEAASSREFHGIRMNSRLEASALARRMRAATNLVWSRSLVSKHSRRVAHFLFK